MQDTIYGQSEPEEEKLARIKHRADFMVKLRKRAKQMKRKRRLQNKYFLAR